ncbi:Zinc finger protein 609 [Heterocephalus glaber]|uniref:Zinc finger protein 609 n=1 Tax=Heterocephalus glaber TaxID=10181 RepID=G5BIN4_HETGA|nr:Zinc finger protein 609 [Heterocephalus glaber]
MSLSSGASGGKGVDANPVETYHSGDEWDIGVGNLIIDLDADLEKDQQKLEMSGSKEVGIPAPSAVATLPDNIKFVTPVPGPQGKEGKSKSKRNKSGKDTSKSTPGTSLCTPSEGAASKKEVQGRSGDGANAGGLVPAIAPKGLEKAAKASRSVASSKKEKENSSSKSKKERREGVGTCSEKDPGILQPVALGGRGGQFCDSPTSDLEMRNGRGRGKRMRLNSNTPVNETATASDSKGTSSSSKTRAGANSKGHRGSQSSSEHHPPASGSSEDVKASPSSNILIDCPHPNCNKKYKHINGLKYHQAHTHTEDESKPEEDGDTTPKVQLIEPHSPSPSSKFSTKGLCKEKLSGEGDTDLGALSNDGSDDGPSVMDKTNLHLPDQGKGKSDLCEEKKPELSSSSQQPSIIQQRPSMYMQSLYHNQYAYVPPYGYGDQGYHAHLLSTNAAYRQHGDEWDIGVGNLIIDLDADLEKDQQKLEMSGSKEVGIPAPNAVATLPDNIKFVTPVPGPQGKEGKSKSKRNKSGKDTSKSTPGTSLCTPSEGAASKKEVQGRSGDGANAGGLVPAIAPKGLEKAAKASRSVASSKKEKENSSSKSKKERREGVGTCSEKDPGILQPVALGGRGGQYDASAGVDTGAVEPLGSIAIEPGAALNPLVAKPEPEEGENECRPLKKVKSEKMESPVSTPAVLPLHLLVPVVNNDISSPWEQIMVLLIDCPHPNCNKKYKHINGLKYHQAHTHTEDESKPEEDGDSEYGEEPTLHADLGAAMFETWKDSFQELEVSPAHCACHPPGADLHLPDQGKGKSDLCEEKKPELSSSSQQPSIIQQRPSMYMQSLYHNQYAYVPPYGYGDQGYHAHLLSTNAAYRQQYEEQQKRQGLEPPRGPDKKAELGLKDSRRNGSRSLLSPRSSPRPPASRTW